MFICYHTYRVFHLLIKRISRHATKIFFMYDRTFNSRVLTLLHKCRKAVKIYTSMIESTAGRSDDASLRQLEQWKEVNSELLGRLSEILQNRDPNELKSSFFDVREYFYKHWRESEGALHKKHLLLSDSIERQDYVISSLLCEELISLKACSQASRAAYYEIHQVIKNSKEPVGTDLVEDGAVLEESLLFSQAKIIPFARGS